MYPRSRLQPYKIFYPPDDVRLQQTVQKWDAHMGAKTWHQSVVSHCELSCVDSNLNLLPKDVSIWSFLAKEVCKWLKGTHKKQIYTVYSSVLVYLICHDFSGYSALSGGTKLWDLSTLLVPLSSCWEYNPLDIFVDKNRAGKASPTRGPMQKGFLSCQVGTCFNRHHHHSKKNQNTTYAHLFFTHYRIWVNKLLPSCTTGCVPVKAGMDGWESACVGLTYVCI